MSYIATVTGKHFYSANIQPLDAWRFIRERSDLHFVIITKRIHRFEVSLPDDWGGGYENVTICATCENQRRADERIPLLSLPIEHRRIAHEPMPEHIDIERYLKSGLIEKVTCGGESGDAEDPVVMIGFLTYASNAAELKLRSTFTRRARTSSRMTDDILSHARCKWCRRTGRILISDKGE